MLRLTTAFRDDERGGVAILFGLSALSLVGLVGGGADFGRLQLQRQSIGNSLALTCQFINKSASAGDIKAISTEARAFFASSSEGGSAANIEVDVLPGAKEGEFAVRAKGTVPTYFMKIAGVETLPLNVTQNCAPGSLVATPPPPPRTPGTVVLRETFESGVAASNSGWLYVRNYNGWTATGEGLELSAGYKQGAPEGRSVGELVADRGIAMFRKLTLRSGRHELRYWYAGSPWIPTPAYRTPYDPTPICSREPSDVAWATADPTQPSRAAVYLSADTPGWSESWMGMLPSNRNWRPADLIDLCIHSNGWVERSITIDIPRDGDYWLVFAGQGTHNAPEGPQIDDIRLCVERCEGTRRLAPWETPGTVLFSENFRSWPVGCCSIDPTPYGWTSYRQDRHEVWDGAWFGTPPSGPYNMVEIDNGGNVSLGRSFLLAQGVYELRYSYAPRIKFNQLADVATCGANQNAPAIRAFPTGSAIASSGDWQNVARNYNTNAMSVFIDNESLASTALPANMVEYCVYGGALGSPMQRAVRFQVTRPGFHRLTFRGEGASDTVGAMLSHIMLCADNCSGQRSSSPVQMVAR